MELKQERMVSLMYLWMWWSTCIHVKAETDSLRPGDSLNHAIIPTFYSNHRKYYLAFGATSEENDYLVVWNNERLTVWIGNRNQPVDPKSASLTLNHSGVLKIVSQHEKGTIFYSPPQPINNTVATLLDTGNFVVQQLHPNRTKTTLWQSFDTPTFTLIPTMKLGVNHKTGHHWLLVSPLTNSVMSPGAFTLEWEHMEQELVIKRRGKVCWRSGKLNNNRFEHIPEDAQGLLKYNVVSTGDDSSFSFTTTSDEDISWRLSKSGRLRKYNGPFVWANLCYGYNNSVGGCQRWQEIPKCRKTGDVFEENTIYNYSKYQNVIYESNSSYGRSDCQSKCWSNCSCVGFKNLYSNGTGCTFFHGNLRKYIILGDKSVTIYMILNKNQHHGNKKKWIWITIVIAVTTTALLIICLSITCLALKNRKYRLHDEKWKRMVTKMLCLTTCNRSSDMEEFEDDLKKGHELKVFDYTSMVTATNGFSSDNMLGQGGFGPVYKGILPTGQEIALKRLSKTSRQGIEEFKNELRLICELQHMNLVQLLGYCIHEEERILVDEYMPNKSLDLYLFDSTRSNLLDWRKLLSIIEGISQGLLYLHKYSRLKVIHRDLKASNILLYKNMNPKISDFGIARMFMPHESIPYTDRIVGTYGYMSPEYALEGVFSTKSDVYSFGVLLLEIVSGRRNTSFYDAYHPLNLIGHTWELWNDGECLQIVDPSLNDLFDPDEVQRCIHVGLLCVEQYANDRPTMSAIISMLTNKSTIISLPQKPAFYVKRDTLDEKLSSKELCTDSTPEITASDKMESSGDARPNDETIVK